MWKRKRSDVMKMMVCNKIFWVFFVVLFVLLVLFGVL